VHSTEPPAAGPTPGQPTPGQTTEQATEQTTVRALAELDQTPLAGHPDIYQRIHADLQGALADIDDA